MNTFRIALLALITSLLLISPKPATANIALIVPDSGGLEQWGAVSIGASTKADKFSTTSSIDGDIAVGGNGNLTIGSIGGNLYYRSNGQLKMTIGANVTGGTFHHQDSMIDSVVDEAMATANAAAGMQTTNFLPSVDMQSSGQSFSVTGASGGTVVLNLKNFRLASNATFTLQGTATTTFVINVQKQFSLAGTSKILLAGGVSWNDVLFNVRGSGSAKISDEAQFAGMLLAVKGTVKVSGNATVSGSVIGNRLLVSGGATVTHPPVTSP